jgi:hypothetical protein
MKIATQLKDNALLFLLIIVVFLGGFFLGSKYQGVTNSQELADTRVDTTLRTPSATSLLEELNIDTNVEYVYWVAYDEEPECPITHPIKGKVNSDVNVFYAPDNNSYNRVKPDLCFTDETVATDIAGFLKKF